MAKENLPSAEVLGRRIQEARKARGLTQDELAKLLGIARTTLVAIEKGQRKVTGSELVDCARYLDKPVSEFTRSSDVPEGFAVQLRAAVRHSVDDALLGAITDFEQLCADYLELERICDAKLTRNYPTPYAIGRSAERTAEDVSGRERQRLGLGDGAIHNLRQILEDDVGLRIFVLDLPSNIAAMFSYTELLGGCIALNRKHPPERRRMSLGHEYGHFVTRREQAVIEFLRKYERVPESERFAETFCRAFLMPAQGLLRRFHELEESRGGKTKVADVFRLADYYAVSIEAMTLRLEELRLLSTGSWDRLQGKGLRVREAQQQLGIERTANVEYDSTVPRRYQSLAYEAYDGGKISEGQLGRFLRLGRIETREWLEQNRLTYGQQAAAFAAGADTEAN